MASKCKLNCSVKKLFFGYTEQKGLLRALANISIIIATTTS